LHVEGLDEAIDDATGDLEILLKLGPVGGGGGEDVRAKAIGEDGGGGLGPIVFLEMYAGGRSPNKWRLPFVVDDDAAGFGSGSGSI
jgi:hypothetical protein